MGVPEGKGKGREKEREDGRTRPTCVIVDEVDGAAGGGESVRRFRTRRARRASMLTSLSPAELRQNARQARHGGELVKASESCVEPSASIRGWADCGLDRSQARTRASSRARSFARSSASATTCARILASRSSRLSLTLPRSCLPQLCPSLAPSSPPSQDRSLLPPDERDAYQALAYHLRL